MDAVSFGLKIFFQLTGGKKIKIEIQVHRAMGRVKFYETC